jgi:hypothetical protein
MSRAKQRADRIRAEISMADVLQGLGYRIRTDAGDREQSFSCDLHGDGRDSRPSAIYYPSSNSAHCFACGRTRDAITWIKEKEGRSFWEVVKLLESRYNLPTLPWVDDAPRAPSDKAQDILEDALGGDHDPSPRINQILRAACVERESDPVVVAKLYEAYDMMQFRIEKSGYSPSIREGLGKILLAAKRTA